MISSFLCAQEFEAEEDARERSSAQLVDESLSRRCERILTEAGRYVFVLAIKSQEERCQRPLPPPDADGDSNDSSKAITTARIGAAMRCGQQSAKPAWVSVGHRVSLESAADIVATIVRQVKRAGRYFVLSPRPACVCNMYVKAQPWSNSQKITCCHLKKTVLFSFSGQPRVQGIRTDSTSRYTSE